MYQLEQRLDSQERHKHWDLGIRWLHQFDQRHDRQRRHQHRNEMFQDCTNLSNITIPDSVTNIGIEAFRSAPACAASL